MDSMVAVLNKIGFKFNMADFRFHKGNITIDAQALGLPSFPGFLSRMAIRYWTTIQGEKNELSRSEKSG